MSSTTLGHGVDVYPRVLFQSCRLGRHAPIKLLSDGILKVGKKAAEKLSNDEAEQWFDLIGDSATASLVRLYSQVGTI